jgi:hypothetical protein
MARQKKRPEQHPMELTTDEAMERLFSKEVRDKLKEVAQKADKNKEKSPHK